jgi:hypothetical protein
MRAMYVMPRQPSSMGQVLDSTVHLFKLAYVPLLPLLIVSALLGLVPGAYLLIHGAPAGMKKSTDLFRDPQYVMMLCAYMVVALPIHCATYVRAESVARGRKIGIGTALWIALKRLPVALASSIFLVIACGVGLVLLIIPFFLLIVLFWMYLPAIMIDNRGVFDALSRSSQLVWGNWWRTARLIFVAGVFAYALYMFLAITLGLSIVYLRPDRTTIQILDFASTVLIMATWIPFQIALTLEVYRDLKLRKDGDDLLERLSAFQPATA